MTKFNKSKENNLLIQKQSIEYRGVLPPPAMLAQYDQIEKGFADRIITMAEKQQDHRFALEQQGLKNMFERDKRIQIIAFILFLALLIGGIVLLALGRSVAGLLTLGPAIVSLIGALIYNKKQEPDRS